MTPPPTRRVLLHHILLLCAAELRRIIVSKRALIGFFAFAAIWYVIFRYPISKAADLISDPAFTKTFITAASATGNSGLLQWPSPHILVYWLTALYLYPLFAIYLGAQQLAPDLQSGFVRFLLLRTSRRSLLLGRFSAHWTLLSVFAVATTATAAFLSGFIQSASDVLALAQAALQAAISLTISIAPFVALTSLVSTRTSSPRGVLSATLVLWFVWDALITWVAHQWFADSGLAAWSLGGFRWILIQRGPELFMVELWRPTVMTLVMLLIADRLSARRPV